MTMSEQEEQELYGPPARHSEYSKGQRIAFHGRLELEGPDAYGTRYGDILYVAAATSGMPMHYVVGPDVGFIEFVYQREILGLEEQVKKPKEDQDQEGAAQS